MILNLLRVEEMSVEGMIKRSFSEFATQRALTLNDYPKLLARGTKTLIKLDEEFKQDIDRRIGAEDIEEYYAASSNALSSAKELLTYLLSSAGSGGGALVAGRVVLVTSARKRGYVRAPAVVLKPPVASSSSASTASEGGGIICVVLLPQSYTSDRDKEDEPLLGDLNYVGLQRDRFYAVHELSLGEILLVSNQKCKLDSKVFLKEKSSSFSMGRGAMVNPFAGAKSMQRREMDDPFAGMMARGKKVDDSSRSKPSLSQETQVVDDVLELLINAEVTELNIGLEVLDLRECAKNMHQGNSAVDFGGAFVRYEQNIAMLRHFRSHYHPNLETHYKAVDRREVLRARVGTLRRLLSNESLQLFPDFLQRKALLQTLGYVDENDTVCLKGRVACEVNTCEGLIVTEMVFGGLLSELEPTEIVAALSALIFQEKTDEEFDTELPERLVASCNGMKAIAIDLGQQQKDHGLHVDPLEYCAMSLKMGLVHVVYEWACGVPFSSICELTDVQEGSIVRCITRFDELCREVRNCARVVGNPTLYRKMEMASAAIKRDIVFASSLYVS
jgi:antiviral helicase SKI2